MAEKNNKSETRKYDLIMTSIDILRKTYSSDLISLENYFSSNPDKFKDIIYEYYDKALKLIIYGRTPKQVKFMLEYEKMNYINNSNSTAEDLKLITTIQHIIPHIQAINFNSFYQICCCVLPSPQERAQIANLLLEISPSTFEIQNHYSCINKITFPEES